MAGKSRYDIYYANHNYSVFAIFFLLAYLIMDYEAKKFVRRKLRNFWENRRVKFGRRQVGAGPGPGDLSRQGQRNEIYVITIRTVEK